jgi:uncharacterized damage-inducible protein DinB
MTASDLQLHIRYSAWASQQLMDAVRALPPGELERPTGISHTSILGTMAHLHFADWIWYTRVAGPLDKPEPTMAWLENEWPDLQQRWERFVDGLSDADLARAIPFRSIRGYDAVPSVEQIVLHLVNHGTLHRGQVMGMIRQLGIEPPGTDLMHFYMTAMGEGPVTTSRGMAAGPTSTRRLPS